MEKSKIKEIEIQKPEELWDKFHDADSEEDVRHVFQDAASKLLNQPNLYYLEVGRDDIFAVVRKRADNGMIYETEVPSEIETLKQAGIEKKDEQ